MFRLLRTWVQKLPFSRVLPSFRDLWRKKSEANDLSVFVGTLTSCHCEDFTASGETGKPASDSAGSNYLWPLCPTRHPDNHILHDGFPVWAQTDMRGKIYLGALHHPVWVIPPSTLCSFQTPKPSALKFLLNEVWVLSNSPGPTMD